jgi:hypothetical protein
MAVLRLEYELELMKGVELRDERSAAKGSGKAAILADILD